MKVKMFEFMLDMYLKIINKYLPEDYTKRQFFKYISRSLFLYRVNDFEVPQKVKLFIGNETLNIFKVKYRRAQPFHTLIRKCVAKITNIIFINLFVEDLMLLMINTGADLNDVSYQTDLQNMTDIYKNKLSAKKKKLRAKIFNKWENV